MDLTNGKADLAARLQEQVLSIASDSSNGTPHIHDTIQILAGVLVESVFLFEEPDEVMKASLTKLSRLLATEACDEHLPEWYGLDAAALDWRAEQGRLIAREIIDEWRECPFSYIDFILFSVHHFFVHWAENFSVPRGESLRLLEEASMRSLAFEITAQELCLQVIDVKITESGWTIADCLCGLSAHAGHILGSYLQKNGSAADFADDAPCDMLMNVMAQEAVRLGVPAGSEWRFGLAANDLSSDPPHDLIRGVSDICDDFYNRIGMREPLYRAVASAKAAGRMLAVVASGEMPDMPDFIAKPLAVMAMTETYRSLNVFMPGTPGSRKTRARQTVR